MGKNSIINMRPQKNDLKSLAIFFFYLNYDTDFNIQIKTSLMLTIPLKNGYLYYGAGRVNS